MTASAVTGTATKDTTGDVKAVKLALAQVDSNGSEKFWNGKAGTEGAFDSTSKVWAFDATDTGTKFSTWTANLTSVLQTDGSTDGKYKVYAYAQDTNTGVPADADKVGSASFTLDTTAPSLTKPTAAQVIIAGTGNVEVVFPVSEPLSATDGSGTTSEIVTGTAVDSGAYTITKVSGATGSAPTATSVEYKITGDARSIVFTFAKSEFVDKNGYKIAFPNNKLVDLAGNQATGLTDYDFTAIAGKPLEFDLETTATYDYDPSEAKAGAAITNANDKIEKFTYAVKDGTNDVVTVNAEGKLTTVAAGTKTISVTANPTDEAAAEGVPYVATTKDYTVTINPYDLKTVIEGFKFVKGYDKQTTATVSDIVSNAVDAENATITGVNGEKLTLAVDAAFTDKTVAKNKDITLTSVTLTDKGAAKASNYEYDGHVFASTTPNMNAAGTLTGKGEITIKELTVNAAPGSKSDITGFDKATYDGTKDTTALGTDADVGADYLTGVAGGDTVALTIKSGAKGEFADENVGTDKIVTVKGTLLKLTGTDKDNYKLPETVPDIKVTADITAKAAPTITLSNVAQTLSAMSAAAEPTAVITPEDKAAAPAEITLKYAVPTLTATATACDCGAGDKLAHTTSCALVAKPCNCTLNDSTVSAEIKHTAACAYTLDPANNCDCGAAEKAGNDKTKAHRSTCQIEDCDCGAGNAIAVATKHDDGSVAADCARNSDPNAHCNCGVGNSVLLADHAAGCAYVDTDTVTWKTWTGGASDYVKALASGSSVYVLAESTASDNLDAIADNTATYADMTAIKADLNAGVTIATGNVKPIKVTYTVSAPTPPSGGGGGSSSYTVKFDAGKNGKITKGNASTSVSSGNKVAASKVPEVTANEGYKFLGWSLDGKTTVDPTAQKITKSVTFTALYEGAETPELNKDEHMAYIKGYTDGAFKPGNDITRAEVAAIFARIVKNEIGTDGTTSFSDVKTDAWYAPSVAAMQKFGMLKGYPDGTFRPDAPITREEFTAMATRMGEITKAGSLPFADVKADSWSVDNIYTAYTAGWIAGYEDGTFRPSANLTRAEAVKMVNAMLERSITVESIEGKQYKTFSDVPSTHWAYLDVIEAANAHAFTKDAGKETWK